MEQPHGSTPRPAVPTALVTGASSGIGRAVAADLADHGYRVLGTSRDPGTVTDPDPRVEYGALDYADPESVAACARWAGDVDVLVNNAGESQSGPFEELPADAVTRLFATNVHGPVLLTQLLLPGMRERGYGRVVMVGSMLASFPVAYRSSYCSAKAALKGFAMSARPELTPFGVWMTTVEPGSIATGIGTRRTRYLEPGSVYADECVGVIAELDRKERAGIPAETVAATIREAIEAERPRPLYAVGSRAPLVFAMRRLLPRAAVERVTNAQFGIRRGGNA